LTTALGSPPLAPGQSLSGLLLVERAEIWVNAGEAREWPGRRRFTIGHELGHWVLHRRGYSSLFCRHSVVTGEERPELPLLEEEANAFAAALLMPAALLREAYARDRDFQRLCRRFGASGAAMGRRLHRVIVPEGRE
jgi:Zn-dependent peptidase ImmA (M78 family)